MKGEEKIKKSLNKLYDLFKKVGNSFVPEFSNIVEMFEKQEKDPIVEFKEELQELIKK